jgi:hypothetical protein
MGSLETRVSSNFKWGIDYFEILIRGWEKIINPRSFGSKNKRVHIITERSESY